LLLAGIWFFLWNYSNHVVKNKLVKLYENQFIPTFKDEEKARWRAAFIGQIGFSKAFIPLFRYSEPAILALSFGHSVPGYRGRGGGGCGSSCGGGGSCGGGCGGCGGCGG